MSEFLTTQEVADRLGVSAETVRRMVDRGVIEHTRTLGQHRRIRVQSVVEYERAQIEPRTVPSRKPRAKGKP